MKFDFNQGKFCPNEANKSSVWGKRVLRDFAKFKKYHEKLLD